MENSKMLSFVEYLEADVRTNNPVAYYCTDKEDGSIMSATHVVEVTDLRTGAFDDENGQYKKLWDGSLICKKEHPEGGNRRMVTLTSWTNAEHCYYCDKPLGDETAIATAEIVSDDSSWDKPISICGACYRKAAHAYHDKTQVQKKMLQNMSIYTGAMATRYQEAYASFEDSNEEYKYDLIAALRNFKYLFLAYNNFVELIPWGTALEAEAMDVIDGVEMLCKLFKKTFTPHWVNGHFKEYIVEVSRTGNYLAAVQNNRSYDLLNAARDVVMAIRETSNSYYVSDYHVSWGYDVKDMDFTDYDQLVKLEERFNYD